jgi:hypothetical protein
LFLLLTNDLATLLHLLYKIIEEAMADHDDYDDPEYDLHELFHDDLMFDYGDNYNNDNDFVAYDDDDDDDSWDQEYGDRFPAYRGRFHEQIIFFRPDGREEQKDILWCLTNGFEEIVKGLWSGPWFDRLRPGERERLQQAQTKEEERTKKQRLERAALRQHQKPYWDWRKDQKKRHQNDPIPEIFRDDPKMPCYCPHKCHLKGCGGYFETAQELETHQAACRDMFACPVDGCSSLRFSKKSWMYDHLELDHAKQCSDDPSSPLYKPWHCPIKNCNHRSCTKKTLIFTHMYRKFVEGSVPHRQWLDDRLGPDWMDKKIDGSDLESDEECPCPMLISEIPRPKGQPDIRIYFSKELAEKERIRIKDF